MPGTRAAYRMSHAPPGVGRRSKEHPDDVVCEHRGAVFEAHGKRLEYAKNSLYLFDEHNRFRIICANIVSHPFFDRVILLFILLNSIVLALTDWSVIDEDPNSEDVGEPVVEGSWRNTLLYESEIVFTVCFTTEFVLKVIAQGFFLGQGSYLRDPWNDLDFVVVVTALLTSIPNMPKMTAIRVFRVLRPLRSVSALPGLQKLVVSMLRSVPQLVSVVILLQFIFTVFGIFGIQIFAGKQHSRCRLTPHPVTTDFEVRQTDRREISTNKPERQRRTWYRLYTYVRVLMVCQETRSPDHPKATIVCTTMTVSYIFSTCEWSECAMGIAPGEGGGFDSANIPAPSMPLGVWHVTLSLTRLFVLASGLVDVYEWRAGLVRPWCPGRSCCRCSPIRRERDRRVRAVVVGWCAVVEIVLLPREGEKKDHENLT